MKRDLSDLKTEKLYDIFLENMQLLKLEKVEPIFQREKEESVEDKLKNSLTIVERWKAN